MSRIKVNYDVLPGQRKINHRVFNPVYKVKKVNEKPSINSIHEVFEYNDTLYNLSKVYLAQNNMLLSNFTTNKIYVDAKYLLNTIDEELDYGTYFSIYPHDDRPYHYDIDYNLDERTVTLSKISSNDGEVMDTIYIYKDGKVLTNTLYIEYGEYMVDDADWSNESSVNCFYVKQVLPFTKDTFDKSDIALQKLKLDGIYGIIDENNKTAITSICLNISEFYHGIDFNILKDFYNVTIYKILTNSLFKKYLFKTYNMNSIFYDCKGMSNNNIAYEFFNLFKNAELVGGSKGYITNARNMFAYSDIEEFDFDWMYDNHIGVDNRIYVNKGDSFQSYMFENCTELKSVYNLRVYNNTNSDFTSIAKDMFKGCTKLKNVTVTNIYSKVSFEDCPDLTLDSLLSICNGAIHLTSDTKKNTITLNKASQAKLTNDIYVKIVNPNNSCRPFEVCNKDDEGAMTIYEYMDYKNWTIEFK